jgi:ferredoxin
MTRCWTVSDGSGGNTYRCAENQSLIEAQRRSGLALIPYGCRGGGCGRCKIRLLSGEYSCGRMSRAHLTEKEARQRYVLACRTYPRSDLCIDISIPNTAAC